MLHPQPQWLLLCLEWIFPASLLSAAGNEEALKPNRQTSCYCSSLLSSVRKALVLSTLETNGSQAGRSIFPSPQQPHSPYWLFFRASCCSTLEWIQIWVSRRISIFSLLDEKNCSVNLAEYLLASAIRKHKIMYFTFLWAKVCFYLQNWVCLSFTSTAVSSLYILSCHHFTFRLPLLK